VRFLRTFTRVRFALSALTKRAGDTEERKRHQGRRHLCLGLPRCDFLHLTFILLCRRSPLLFHRRHRWISRVFARSALLWCLDDLWRRPAFSKTRRSDCEI